jgi:hypothetical protein
MILNASIVHSLLVYGSVYGRNLAVQGTQVHARLSILCRYPTKDENNSVHCVQYFTMNGDMIALVSLNNCFLTPTLTDQQLEQI